MTQSNLNSPSKRASRVNLLLSTLIASAAMAGCADEPIVDFNGVDTVAPTGGNVTPTGGIMTTTGGIITPTGGVTPTGGIQGTGGVIPTGGTVTGGVIPTGGTVTGGTMTGGTMTGGTMTGGTIEPSDCVWSRGEAPTEASASTAGPFKVEKYTTGFDAPPGLDSYTLWYPADATPPFAGVAVVPGFVSPETSIQNWGPFLASHGMAVVTIGVPGLDQPPTRAEKLLGSIEGLKGENTRSGSPLEGKLATGCMAISGWSMGGGGTLMAISSHPELKAAVALAAWGPTGGAANKVPVLMFEATADVLAANMSDGYYADTPNTTPKMLFEADGLDHYFANDPNNSRGIIGRYGLSWYKVFLEGDERYRQFLTAPFPSITTAKSKHNL